MPDVEISAAHYGAKVVCNLQFVQRPTIRYIAIACNSKYITASIRKETGNAVYVVPYETVAWLRVCWPGSQSTINKAEFRHASGNVYTALASSRGKRSNRHVAGDMERCRWIRCADANIATAVNAQPLDPSGGEDDWIPVQPETR